MNARSTDGVTLFLSGDVMTGRGVDQLFPRSVDPELHERFVKRAKRYVRLAEEASGPIPAPVDHAYPWGDALDVLRRAGPDLRIVNLETAVTTRSEPWPGKGIHYRMHPANVPVLTAAGVDVCVLANNHVLDWGRDGLRETLEVLREAGLETAGAGRDAGEARAPAVREVGDAVVRVFGLGAAGAGVPRKWAATGEKDGVWYLPDLAGETAGKVARRVRGAAGDGDLVVASLHWGGNWGYRVSDRERAFAHRLVEEGGVDVVHGHSSHHPRGVEVHRGRPILYGCGDLINDYEGIGGHERYRPDLVLLYLVTLAADDGRLLRLEMRPMRLRRFRLEHASEEETRWLAERMDRECGRLGAGVERADERLVLRWDEGG